MVNLFNYGKITNNTTNTNNTKNSENSEIIYQIYDFKILSKIREFLIHKTSTNVNIHGKNLLVISMNSLPIEIEKNIKSEIINTGLISSLINDTNLNHSNSKISSPFVFDKNDSKTDETNANLNINSKSQGSQGSQGEKFIENYLLKSCYYIEELDEENSLLGFFIESEISPDENLQDHILKDYITHIKKIRENILFDLNK